MHVSSLLAPAAYIVMGILVFLYMSQLLHFWSLKRAIRRRSLRPERFGELEELVLSVVRIKQIAPPAGLLFTVLGLMSASLKFAHGAPQTQLVADLGPALGSTGVSSVLLILETILLHSLYQLRQRVKQR